MARALLCLVRLFGAPAFAQPTEQARVQATTACDAGVAAFAAKDYVEALARFERAYKLDPSPVLLDNLARTDQEMRPWPQAMEHLELHLARVPDGDDRGDVEARVRSSPRRPSPRRPRQGQPSPDQPSPGPRSPRWRTRARIRARACGPMPTRRPG